MKKFCFILAMTALGACSSEENLPSDESVIRLTSEITPMSRGTDLEQQSTQIVSGQKVGVTITGAKSTHNNIAWTVGNNGEMTNTGEPLYWGNSNVTITAYHPYNSTWENTSSQMNFSVCADQTGKGYLDSDLLWVNKTAGISESANPITLDFVHKLSKINISLTSTDISDLSNATISICGTHGGVNFIPATGELLNYENFNIRSIVAGVTATNAMHASAIIIPQTVAANTKFIQVEHDGNYYYYKLPAEKVFETGHSYTYTLKVEKAEELTCSSTKIEQWENEKIVGSSNEEKIQSITVAKAGTLRTLLGNQYLDIEALKISGPISGTDIKILREMLGASATYPPTGKLSILDLSEATIEGGEQFHESNMTLAVDNTLHNLMFQNCRNLSDLTIPNNIVSVIGPIGLASFNLISINATEESTNFASRDGVLYNKDMTTLIKCPTGKYSLSVPNTVKTIGAEAFIACFGLKYIYLPSSIETITGTSFIGCAHQEINVDSDNANYSSLDGILYDKDKTELISCPVQKSEISILNSVSKIGEAAFFQNNILTQITIPANVSEIGQDAFYGCNNLTTVICFAPTAPELGSYAFSENLSAKLYVPKGTLSDYSSWETYFKGGISEIE